MHAWLDPAAMLARAIVLGLAVGCGTTRMTDTQRTATEQLLISNAVDQAVSQLDFRALAGKPVYFDPQYLDGTVDRGYVVSSLRQHLLANGCVLQEDRAKAAYVVEARSGGIGTDRHSLLVGIPQMTIPTFIPGLTLPTQIPEIPFAKKTDQNGVAKIAVFAYNRQSGLPVWQSGVIESVSSARDIWLLGAGPFQNGTIRQGTEFAGQRLALPPFLGDKAEEDKRLVEVIPVTQEVTWPEAPRPGHVRPGPLGTAALGNPPTISGLIRTHLAGGTAPSPPKLQPAGHQSAPAEPNPPLSPAVPNVGGQAQTQPHGILNSGMEWRPD
jgi:hypothetical protein